MPRNKLLVPDAFCDSDSDEPSGMIVFVKRFLKTTNIILVVIVFRKYSESLDRGVASSRIRRRGTPACCRRIATGDPA